MNPKDVELIVDVDNSADPYFIIDVVTKDGALQAMGRWRSAAITLSFAGYISEAMPRSGGVGGNCAGSVG